MDESRRMGNQGEEFEHYRVLLFSIAYRMTGSASDAEDLVQETYLRYQASADQEIVSLKAYLSTIIIRLALDYLKSVVCWRKARPIAARSFIGPGKLCRTSARVSSRSRSTSASFCSVFFPPVRPGTWRL